MIPAYIQIHDQIKSEIDQKIWKIGERLPSERDLAEKFQVSRMTLRQAITLLVEEGVLERRVGSGTFITSTRVQEKMRGTTSFTEIMKSQGKEPSSQVISYRKPFLASKKWINWALIRQRPSFGWSGSGMPMGSLLFMKWPLFQRNLLRISIVKRLPAISSKPWSVMAIRLESRTRPSMRDWPRIRLRTTYRFQKGRLF